MEEQDRSMPSVFTITLIQLLVGALLFVALLNEQRDLTVLTLLVLGVMGGARLWARLSPSGLQCHLMVDKWRVFPGERITLRTSAENSKPLPIWIEMRVPIGDLARGAGQVLTKTSALLWYQRMRFQWGLTAEKRGVYQIGPLQIQAGDLFAFFSRPARAAESHSIIVYPRLVSLQALPLPRRDFFGVPRASSPVQDPIYILGTRDYQSGQPSKHIHWKASARRDRLQEKVFEPTVHEKVLLVVDVDTFVQRAAAEDFERALEIVASLAVRLERKGHSVGLLANGALDGGGIATVPVARNRRQLPAILELLARIEMKTDGDLKHLLRRRLADAWGVCCVYFAYQEDETVFAASKYLDQIKTPAVFAVSQPRATGVDRPATQARVYRLDDLRATESSAPLEQPQG